MGRAIVIEKELPRGNSFLLTFNCENALYILALCVLCLFLHFPQKGERTVGGSHGPWGDYYEIQRWWSLTGFSSGIFIINRKYFQIMNSFLIFIKIAVFLKFLFIYN